MIRKASPFKAPSIAVRTLLFVFALGGLMPLLFQNDVTVSAAADDLSITANFEGREMGSRESISLSLNRPLQPEEGRLAIFIGNTDMTALFELQAAEFIYVPKLFPLPVGDTTVKVFRSDPAGEWIQIAQFSLVVKTDAQSTDAVISTETAATGSDSSPESNNGRTEIKFTPTIALGLKGQNQTSTFPLESEPERNPFTDVDTQIGLELKVSRRGWSLSNKFDFVGVGFRPNALRFGELQDEAPLFDLSSYLIELRKGRFKVNFGHVSFGSNRHLINSFSSRGITAVVPIGKQSEFSLAAMNGTSLVGYDNFIGITQRKHNVLGAGFAHEFIKERPNGLRVEFTVMRGSLLPIASVNQGVINDAETSLGFGFRVKGNDKKDRLRYEVGVTRSRFTNPADPLLEQGQTVTPINETWRTGMYGEISYDLIRDMSVWRKKKFKLTGTYRFEEIEPLFRSIGVSTQADRRQNQFEFSGNFGELNFAFGNLRDRDNLSDIPSILKTLNRKSNIVVGLPLGTFFTPEKPQKWLPQISYTMDIGHQFGAFLPVDGLFADPSQVPDQKNYAQAFNAQWILSEKFTLGYRLSKAFQDNRQFGRERADFRSIVNAFTVGTKPFKSLDLDLDISQEQQNNLEQPRTDNTVRVGARVLWRTPLIKNSSFSSGLSVTLAGDTNDQNDARNAEFDIQWAYSFALGTKKFKKLNTQFFIRYANRYGDTIDRILFVNSHNKTQAFNFGLTFNIL